MKKSAKFIVVSAGLLIGLALLVLKNKKGK